jgi:PadR family transcriptional regulator
MQVETPALRNLFSMVLLSLLACRPLHAYAIIDTLRQGSRGQFKVSEQAVYPALHRLDHLGLVSSSLSMVNGRTRRTYSITPAGRDRLQAEREAWVEFVAVVAELTVGGRQDSP